MKSNDTEYLRFIKTAYTYADFSTSISPAIELAMERREVPGAVVLNIFSKGSFTVGFLDDPEKSLDLDFCRRENLVVRRRQNTGGAIWGPAGGAILVLYLETSRPWVPLKGINKAFRAGLTGMAEVIRDMFSVDAVYRPLNDIEVLGKKLIPSSARLEHGILTLRLLINVTPTSQDIMRKAIIVPPEKVQDKLIKDVGARFTCLETETGRKIGESDLIALSEKTVQKILGPDVPLIPSGLTELEQAYSKELQERFTSPEWFYANSERMRFKEIPAGAVKTEGRRKAPAGLIRVILLTFREKIHDLIITGDFHPSPHHVLADMENALRGEACNEDVIRTRIRRIFERPGVEMAGMDVEDFAAAFMKALSTSGH